MELFILERGTLVPVWARSEVKQFDFTSALRIYTSTSAFDFQLGLFGPVGHDRMLGTEGLNSSFVTSGVCLPGAARKPEILR